MVGFEFLVILASLLNVTSSCPSMALRYPICFTVMYDNPHPDKISQDHLPLIFIRLSKTVNKCSFFEIIFSASV